MTKKKVLVICVDRDNDLREKVGINGPVIGRDANLEAAAKLALADPEEPDANTMFQAVRILDKLGPDEGGQVVTLTGHRRLGYDADKAISSQLDSVLREYPADYCIFVSDGASDSEVLPMIQSRIKVNSTKIVVMKQAKELEKTYFVLLEKLKEPHYQRLVFGIPGLIILTLGLMFTFASDLSWKPLGIIVGLYLLAKGSGFEERISSSISGFSISVERIGFILYLAAVPLLLISLWLGVQDYATKSGSMDAVKVAAYTVRSSLVLFPWAIILILIGKVVDLLQEKRRYEVVKYGLYGVSLLILWLIFTVASDWVVAEAYFSEFVLTIIGAIVLSAVSITVMRGIRANIASSMKLENKEVLNQIGAYVGKIIGVDKKRGVLVVQTPFGQRININLENISDIGEKVLVKY
jgi:putative membrane protein